MSRKKVILSIFLLILMVIVGIVLPAIWKHQNKETDTEKKPSKPQTEAPKDEPSETELKYTGFQELSSFFSDSQISDFKELFPSYFSQTGLTGITEVTFLPKETGYPDKQSETLMFSLSNGSKLPVTYRTDTGAFLFGKEKLQLDVKPRSYEKATDNTLPSITTEEIEALSEGGFPDTLEEGRTDTSPNTEAAAPDKGSKDQNTTEEVQP